MNAISFVYPTFLFALAALIIPIIIHLFYFRRFKKVYFTNVKFLKELKEERASRNRLKHFLVLFSRMAALAFLVFAFAQPYIPQTEAEVVRGTKAASVFIDNSFSMNALSNDVSLFEKAKRKAREIVEAYGPEDRFQIITNDFEGKHQRLLDKDEFIGYLDELEISPNVQNLNEVFSRQKQALEYANVEQRNMFLISDFQKNVVDLENDTAYNVYLVPLQSVEQQNVFIDSVWFSSPIRMLNQANKLIVRIRNTGETAVEASRLELRINEQTKSIKEFNVAAESTVIDTISFTITETGWHNAEMKITDYPINFDDTYYFTFEVAEKIDVLVINENKASPYLQAIFRSNSSFRAKNQSASRIEYSTLPKNQLIILNQVKDISSGLAYELQQYVFGGGNLLIFPNKNMKKTSYNSLLKALKANTYISFSESQKEIEDINTRQEVFRDVFERIPRNLDLPFCRGCFDMTSYSSTGEEVLLKMRGGSSFLSKYNFGEGKAYMCAAPLDTKYTNLPSHAIFVPMIYKITLVGSKEVQLAYTIGENELVEVENRAEKKDSKFKLKGPAEEFIPGQKVEGTKLVLNLNNRLKEAGVYELFLEPQKALTYFGFNFNRQESILDYFKMEELQEKYTAPNILLLEEKGEPLSKIVGQIDRGLELWKWCLLAVLAFLFIETLLLRLWKN
ncbi:MAG: vWA domain-containing protein [Chitinophagales bacterium]